MKTLVSMLVVCFATSALTASEPQDLNWKFDRVEARLTGAEARLTALEKAVKASNPAPQSNKAPVAVQTVKQRVRSCDPITGKCTIVEIDVPVFGSGGAQCPSGPCGDNCQCSPAANNINGFTADQTVYASSGGGLFSRWRERRSGGGLFGRVFGGCGQ